MFRRAHMVPDAPTLAGWQSGHAAACKAVYAGSIPTPASKLFPKHRIQLVVLFAAQVSRARLPLQNLGLPRVIHSSLPWT